MIEFFGIAILLILKSSTFTLRIPDPAGGQSLKDSFITHEAYGKFGKSSFLTSVLEPSTESISSLSLFKELSVL